MNSSITANAKLPDVTRWEFTDFPDYAALQRACLSRHPLKLAIAEYRGHTGEEVLREAVATLRVSGIIPSMIKKVFVICDMECEHATWTGIQIVVSKETTGKSGGRKTFQCGSYERKE